MRYAAGLAVIGLLLSFVFFPVAAGDQNQEMDKEDLPVGDVSQTAMKVQYQSAKEKGRRTYRVRNAATGIKTEVLWKDPTSPLLQTTLVLGIFWWLRVTAQIS